MWYNTNQGNIITISKQSPKGLRHNDIISQNNQKSKLSLVVNPAHLSSKYLRPRSTRGFTIVELLIVIVVIGILAAISIVAYNGIQQKATTASNHSAIRNYIQAFQLMKTQTGSLPTANSCLGPSGTYASGTCYAAGQNGTVNTTTNNQLANYGLTNQPAVKTNSVSPDVVFASSFYGEPALLWVVQGSQDCIASTGRFRVGSSSWVEGRSSGAYGAEGDTACYMSLGNL